jgi:hypothetical protein
MQQIHGIDRQGGVGGVLARRVGELLVGVDSELPQDLAPERSRVLEKSP